MDNEETPKVITIKLPFDLQERILTFPFLHALSERFPKAELHIITPRKEVEVLNLLPFKAYYHLFDEHEIKTILDVHPFTANSQIYNVDLFISLSNGFADAALGLGLRARKRVGFSDHWKTLFLTHKMKRPLNHHVSDDFLALYSLATGEPANSRIRVTARSLPPIITGGEEYIALNLSPLRNGEPDKEWYELLTLMEGQTIVLFSSEDQVQAQLSMDAFISTLPAKNTYINFRFHDWIELGRMLAHARGVITYSGACGALAAYTGARTLILYENEDPQKTGPFSFLADVAILGVNNPEFVNSTSSTTVLKERVTFNMDEVFAKACDFLGI